MAAYFFDSSALVKRYVREAGTSFVIGLVKPSARHQLYVARIALVEVVSALTRRQRKGALTPDAYTKAVTRFRRVFMQQFFALGIEAALIEQATSLAAKYALRGYDAVQLAAVLEIQRVRALTGVSPITLISADKALNTAAQAEGLVVDGQPRQPFLINSSTCDKCPAIFRADSTRRQ